jgi:cytochrome P450
VDPAEPADGMVEEVIEPYLEELKKYQELDMHTEANRMCMGLLLGLHQFEHESTSEFKDWTHDAPDNFAWVVVDTWKARAPNRADVKAVKAFIEEELGGW